MWVAAGAVRGASCAITIETAGAAKVKQKKRMRAVAHGNGSMADAPPPGRLSPLAAIAPNMNKSTAFSAD
jgi:hypothetical protein